MCTYLISKEVSWMTKARSTSLLVTTLTPKVISSTILILERQSLVEMSYLMKKREWDWGPHDEDYNFFPYFEEDDI